MRIALFIDADNFIRSAQGLRLPVEIEPVLLKLKEYGKVAIRRCVGDLERHCRDAAYRQRIREMFHKNLVQIQDIPHLTPYKNGADIQLVIEALCTAHTHNDIDCYTIVAADRDYMALVSKLHEMGKTVIGIGFSREQTNQDYVKAFDIFFYYESLFAVQQPSEVVRSSQSQDIPVLLDAYFDLLERAILAIEEQGRKPVGAVVSQMMRNLQPDFEPSLVKMNSFKEFIKKAEGAEIVKVEWSTHGDFSLRLHPNRQVSDQRTLILPESDLSDAPKLAAYYEALLQRKTKIPFPKLDLRRKILAALQTKYNELKPNGDMSLREWSSAAYNDGLNALEGVTQPMVFKMLYALWLSRCFETIPTSNPYDPVVRNVACDPSEWEQRLHMVFIRTVRMAKDDIMLAPEAFSWLFYGDSQHADEMRDLIAILAQQHPRQIPQPVHTSNLATTTSASPVPMAVVTEVV